MLRKKNDFPENLLFKTPNSHGMSSRQLLADAFDELVQIPKERELMDQYKANISILTCIAGSIAEGFYGVPEELKEECRNRLPKELCCDC